MPLADTLAPGDGIHRFDEIIEQMDDGAAAMIEDHSLAFLLDQIRRLPSPGFDQLPMKSRWQTWGRLRGNIIAYMTTSTYSPQISKRALATIRLFTSFWPPVHQVPGSPGLSNG